MDDDERIAPFLKRLKYRYLGEDFSSATHLEGQGIQLSQIDAVSVAEDKLQHQDLFGTSVYVHWG